MTKPILYAFLALSFLFQNCKGLFIKNELKQHFLNNPAFEHHFTGFALYTVKKGKEIYSHHSHKFFTPASNTKLFTLYASSVILGDTLPGIKYITRGDSLLFQGMGDPTLLHPNFPHHPILSFLEKHNGPIFYHQNNFLDPHFGPGWSWDDYPYYYSCEKAALPVHGNFIEVREDTFGILKVAPKLFTDSLVVLPSSTNRVVRDLHTNTFQFFRKGEKQEMRQWVPFRHSPSLALTLLADSLGKPITPIETDYGHEGPILYSFPVDSLYQPMMYESDNFFAEQMLLMSSAILFDTLDSHRVIQYTLDSLLQDIPHRPRWVDGSGLSRYNLFSPISFIYILRKLYDHMGSERLFNLLPTGGKGTLSNWYKGTERPYVFAKTGSLSNNHNLSGFLRTKKGKTWVFSFMHNHFQVPSDSIKREMEAVLQAIHQRF